MGRKKTKTSSRKRKSYNNYYGYTLSKKEQKEAALGIITVMIIVVFLWFIFIVGMILLIAGIIYGAYKFQEYFRFEILGQILTSVFALCIIFILSTFVFHRLGLVHNTFTDWAKNTSSYLQLNMKRGKLELEANPEGIAQEALFHSLTGATQ